MSDSTSQLDPVKDTESTSKNTMKKRIYAKFYHTVHNRTSYITLGLISSFFAGFVTGYYSRSGTKTD
jgi:hypothetical protein